MDGRAPGEPSDARPAAFLGLEPRELSRPSGSRPRTPLRELLREPLELPREPAELPRGDDADSPPMAGSGEGIGLRLEGERWGPPSEGRSDSGEPLKPPLGETSLSGGGVAAFGDWMGEDSAEEASCVECRGEASGELADARLDAFEAAMGEEADFSSFSSPNDMMDSFMELFIDSMDSFMDPEASKSRLLSWDLDGDFIAVLFTRGETWVESFDLDGDSACFSDCGDLAGLEGETCFSGCGDFGLVYCSVTSLSRRLNCSTLITDSLK
jgi:hypothetical protein